jgi:glycosyltransferase involved in cell wall biosynthesis
MLVTRKAIAGVDCLVTVSAELKRDTLRLAAPRRAIRVIANAADPSRFSPMDQSAARAELGLTGDGPLLVYASRLDEAKGLSHLLVALRRVLNRLPDCRLAIIGEGPHRRQLEREVDEMELRHAVLFAGFHPHSDVALWMNASDLVVHPSLSEGSPLPIYEAMACGRPSVATNVGGIPEIVTSDDFGLLVPPADPAALADALLDGIAREWDRDRIRSRGASHTWGHVADQLLDVYRKVLQGNGNRRSLTT